MLNFTTLSRQGMVGLAIAAALYVAGYVLPVFHFEQGSWSLFSTATQSNEGLSGAKFIPLIGLVLGLIICANVVLGQSSKTLLLAAALVLLIGAPLALFFQVPADTRGSFPGAYYSEVIKLGSGFYAAILGGLGLLALAFPPQLWNSERETSVNKPDGGLFLIVCFMVLAAPILLNPFPVDSALSRFNAGYPALMQSFAIFGILAIGFNILFGLTGYLSFGHAAFLGAGSYAAVWMYKLLNFNVVYAIPAAIIVAGLLSLIIGYVSLRRSGIYFSILTLAFAQMSYALAYSVLTPITNGETGLQVYNNDPQYLLSEGDLRTPHFFGLDLNSLTKWRLGGWEFTFEMGYYFCAIFLILAFYLSIRIFRSPFGMMLRAIKSNQQRLNYTGLNSRPYTLAAFVISGLYAGLAGGLMAAMDPLTGAERMFWTASGEIVLMSILGGVGTLIGPVLGAGAIKYMEKIISSINDNVLHLWFNFMPEWLENVFVTILHPFVGKGWHLTLGLVFMLVVIFLPGGLVEGGQKIGGLFRRKKTDAAASGTSATPAE